MSQTTELADLYSAIEVACELLNVDCSRDTVWPVLTAYGSPLPAVVAFRVATDARNEGEFNCRFLALPGDVDPYAVAVDQGLTERTDHPVSTLLGEIAQRCPIDSYGVDFGVVGGFQKIWAFFPGDDFQRPATLADLPSAPRALADNLDFFARHGLTDNMSLIGIDYPSRTMNVYFGELPEGCCSPENIPAMHRELGLSEPSETMLRLCEPSFGLYTTLNWESSRIERIAFSVMAPDPLALPVQLHPKIEQFVKAMPYGADDPKIVYAATAADGGEYYKLQSYYRWRNRMLDLMQVSDEAESAE